MAETPKSTKKVTVPTIVNQPNENSTKLGKLKLAFLYVLIGGLVVSALISVVAILIGEFNSMVQKAIVTTISLVIHSSLVLLVILADRNNQIGKSIVPTTFIVTLVASMITSTLGVWGVIDGDLSWRIFFVYALFIGASYLVDGLLRLRLQKQSMLVLAYTSIGLFVLLTFIIAPWILFFDHPWVNDLYYRIMGALSILAVTSLVVTAIMNRILVAQQPALAKSKPKLIPYSPGMLAVVITLGVIIIHIWFFGLIGITSQAATYERYEQYEQYDHYDRYNERYENNRYE